MTIKVGDTIPEGTLSESVEFDAACPLPPKDVKVSEAVKGKRIVVTVTGHGLKDIQWALEAAADPIVVPVDAKAAAEKLGLA